MCTIMCVSGLFIKKTFVQNQVCGACKRAVHGCFVCIFLWVYVFVPGVEGMAEQAGRIL